MARIPDFIPFALKAIDDSGDVDIGFAVYNLDPEGTVKTIADPVTTIEVDALQTPTPVVTLDAEQAQTLFEELWREGLRPATPDPSEGELAALREHIDDLQLHVSDLRELLQFEGE